MPESTSYIFDQREAAFWVMRFEEGDPDLNLIPPLDPTQLIRFVGILRRLGHPDSLRDDLEAIARARKALGSTLRDDGARQPIDDALVQLEEWRDCEFRAAIGAVDVLEREGWGYDPETQRLKHVTGKGGRPGHYLTDLTGHFWELIRPQYREETGDSSHNSQALRDRIAFRMATLLPEDEVDPRRKGPLNKAIRSYLRKRFGAGSRINP